MPTPPAMTNRSNRCSGMQQQDLLVAIGQVSRRLDDWTEQQSMLATAWTGHFIHVEALLERLLKGEHSTSSPMFQLSRKPQEITFLPATPTSCSTLANQESSKHSGSQSYSQRNGTSADVPPSVLSKKYTAKLPSAATLTSAATRTMERTPLNASSQVDLSSATNMYAQDAHLHWRRMIRKEINRRPLDPLSKHTAAELNRHLSLMQLVVRSHTYEVGSLILVLVNATFIGWQVEYFATHGIVPPHQQIGETVFCILFSLELMMRIISERCGFFQAKDWTWNVFDVMVVVMMQLEQLIDAFSPLTTSSSLLSQMSVLRVLRLVRVVRVLKIIRMLIFFRELRMMVHSILSSFKSLVWAVLVQGVMFYIFGISLTQGVVDYCARYDSWTTLESQEMLNKFGTLGRSVLSLFEAMCGGISWGELYSVLAPLHNGYKAVFLVYIAFAIFAVANIVTAVFVEGAMVNAQHDREMIIQEQLRSNEAYLESMQQIFHELDRDIDGSITLEEIRQAMKDERVVAYLSAFGLDITDVNSLFVLLDRDQKGEIDIDEFLLGCMRLKGEAKSLDIANLQYECDWIVHNVEGLVAGVSHLAGILEHNGMATLSSSSLKPTTLSSGSLKQSIDTG